MHFTTLSLRFNYHPTNPQAIRFATLRLPFNDIFAIAKLHSEQSSHVPTMLQSDFRHSQHYTLSNPATFQPPFYQEDPTFSPKLFLPFAMLWLPSNQIFANPSPPLLKHTKETPNQSKEDTKPGKIFAIANATLWATQGYSSLHSDYSKPRISP